jgi:hypothetical protein
LAVTGITAAVAAIVYSRHARSIPDLALNEHREETVMLRKIVIVLAAIAAIGAATLAPTVSHAQPGDPIAPEWDEIWGN